MKKILLFSLLVFTYSLSAQEPQENSLVLFNGGRTDVRYSYYIQLLSGMGNSLGYHSSQAWDVWCNPASLVTFRQSFVGLNIQPPLWIDPASFSDINQTIAEEVDNAIVDYKTPETNLLYPTLGVKLNQSGGLYGFQYVLPLERKKVDYGVFSAQVGQPFYMNLSTVNDGIETLIETRKKVGDQNKVIKLRMNILLQTELLIRATQYSMGYAKKINENASFGMNIGQTFVNAVVSSQAKMSGIMETAGTEYVFNDPYDPRIDFANGETNKLGSEAFMNFKGSGTNIHMGALYKVTKSFVVGMDYNWQSEINMGGKMRVEQYKIPALNENALFNSDENANPDENEDIMDATKLDLAKLTLTEPVDNKTSDQLLLSFPSSLGIQASFQGQTFEATLNLQKYFNAFGYDFLDETYMANLNFGMEFIMRISIFELALSAVNAELVQEKAGILKSQDKYWIPGAAMNFSFFVRKNYQVDTRLFFAPTPGLGVKFGYFF